MEDLEQLYFRTLLLALWGGEPRRRWLEAVDRLLLDHQVLEGHAKGSWRLAGNQIEWVDRQRATALCIAILNDGWLTREHPHRR